MIYHEDMNYESEECKEGIASRKDSLQRYGEFYNIDQIDAFRNLLHLSENFLTGGIKTGWRWDPQVGIREKGH